jgi:arabinan endo-1,5-alpha-L-arabinosidase
MIAQNWNSAFRVGAVLLAGLTAAAGGVSQTATAPPGPQAPLAPAQGAGGRGFGPAIGVPTLGMPFVHDPSTVVRFHGKYYVYSTGRGIPFYSSPDGATWTREGSVFAQIPDAVHAAVPKNDGTGVWAPDIIRVGGEFYLFYAVSSWGSFNSAIGLATNPVLDPKDPAYKWTDRGVVVRSDGKEDLNAIDPGAILTPDGQLWICYGSYHGSIRVTQLDPKTGLPLRPKELGAPVATARESEASDIIVHDGYYYLFVNHNSCCKGSASEYNIRVGRSSAVDGPYVDKHGAALATGGGSLFLAAHDHRIGPGHFGRLLDYDEPADGAERFSVHYEADLTRGGRSVLDIRPLLWSLDGWPVAGDNVVDGAYQIVSRQSENTLEERVAAAAPAGAAAGPSTARPAAPNAPPVTPTAAASATPVARLARYLALANQRWTITPVDGGFYKIVNAATGDALGTAAEGAGVSLSAYSGADGQMWHLDQFPDGGWRIRNKMGLSLRMIDGGALALAPFARDDLHLWSITTP